MLPATASSTEPVVVTYHPEKFRGLTPSQCRVATALAAGETISAVARSMNINRSTIHRWMQNSPTFTAALDDARAEYAAEFSDKLHELSASALDTIHALMTDPNAASSVRLRAALAIFNKMEITPANLAPPTETTPENEAEPTEQPEPPQQHNATPCNTPITSVPRNSLCPCGSNQKYKRCCGRNAPPVLTTN